MSKRVVFKFFLLTLVSISAVGCTSLTDRSMTRDELSMVPSGRIAGGQRAWNAGDPTDEYYAERRDSSIKFKDFAPEKLPNTFKKIVGHGPNRETAENALIEGRKLYAEAVVLWKDSPNDDATQEAFLQGIAPLKLAADRWADSVIEEDALFLLGECYFFANHYPDANKTYERLAELYPSTRYLDKVQSHRFAIAQYWLSVDQSRNVVTQAVNFTDERLPLKDISGEGRRIYERIRLDDPTGKLADDSTFALGKALFDSMRYFEAAETFSDLRNNYPGSDHQFNAHLMEFQSRLALYDGKNYDGLALKQAEEVLRMILRRFPEESEKIQDQLAEQAGSIRNMLAERDLELADYYIKRGENQAGLIYLRKLVEEYPETDVAKIAHEKAATLEGKPLESEQPVKWLVDMFPTPQSTRPLIRTGSLK